MSASVRIMIKGKTFKIVEVIGTYYVDIYYGKNGYYTTVHASLNDKQYYRTLIKLLLEEGKLTDESHK
jgi:hypothetical protein